MMASHHHHGGGGSSNSSSSSTTTTTKNARVALDRLFQCDAALSITTGVLGVTLPHTFWIRFMVTTASEYNHNLHEMIRLYASVRLAIGWMLWNVRSVDDGLFRRRICESMMVCNIVQGMIVLRAIGTDSTATAAAALPTVNNNNRYNWFILIVLTILAVSYGRFRFGRGGHFIKIYELPTSAMLQ